KRQILFHHQFFRTMTYLTFPIEMNDIGTLFSLFGMMSANFHQGINDPIESIMVIIMNDQNPFIVHAFQQTGIAFPMLFLIIQNWIRHHVFFPLICTKMIKIPEYSMLTENSD